MNADKPYIPPPKPIKERSIFDEPEEEDEEDDNNLDIVPNNYKNEIIDKTMAPNNIIQMTKKNPKNFI